MFDYNCGAPKSVRLWYVSDIYLHLYLCKHPLRIWIRACWQRHYGHIPPPVPSEWKPSIAMVDHFPGVTCLTIMGISLLWSRFSTHWKWLILKCRSTIPNTQYLFMGFPRLYFLFFPNMDSSISTTLVVPSTVLPDIISALAFQVVLRRLL